MRSPRPEAPLALFVDRLGDDDPKLCTGHRLLRRRLAGPPPARPGPGRLVVLDPYAEVPVSREDRERGEGLAGVLAVDCSWNRLGARGRLRGARRRGELPRRLPWLLAANPQHFGRVGELNTAEALAAALFLYGEPERARSLLAAFPGGGTFFELNAPAIDEYAEAPDAEGVRAVERRRFGGVMPPDTPGPRSPGARSAPSRRPPGP